MMFAPSNVQFDSMVLSTFVRCMGCTPGTIVVLSMPQAWWFRSTPPSPCGPWCSSTTPVPHEEAILVDLEEAPDVSVNRTLRPTQLSPEAHAYLSPRKRKDSTTPTANHEQDRPRR